MEESESNATWGVLGHVRIVYISLRLNMPSSLNNHYNTYQEGIWCQVFRLKSSFI